MASNKTPAIGHFDTPRSLRYLCGCSEITFRSILSLLVAMGDRPTVTFGLSTSMGLSIGLSIYRLRQVWHVAMDLSRQ